MPTVIRVFFPAWAQDGIVDCLWITKTVIKIFYVPNDLNFFGKVWKLDFYFFDELVVLKPILIPNQQFSHVVTDDRWWRRSSSVTTRLNCWFGIACLAKERWGQSSAFLSFVDAFWFLQKWEDWGSELRWFKKKIGNNFQWLPPDRGRSCCLVVDCFLWCVWRAWVQAVKWVKK